MHRVRRILLTEFYAALLLTAAVIGAFESHLMLPGDWYATESSLPLMIIQTVMQLSTLILLPLALYLFRLRRKMKPVSGQTDRRLLVYLKWAVARMSMLCVPMVLNLFFYYMFGCATGFFYLGVILLLADFFVYPSEGRCRQEYRLYFGGENE